MRRKIALHPVDTPPLQRPARLHASQWSNFSPLPKSLVLIWVLFVFFSKYSKLVFLRRWSTNTKRGSASMSRMKAARGSSRPMPFGVGGGKKGACTPSVLGLSSTTCDTAFCAASASRAVVGARFVSTSFSAASASRAVVGARFVSTSFSAASPSRAVVGARSVSTESGCSRRPR